MLDEHTGARHDAELHMHAIRHSLATLGLLRGAVLVKCTFVPTAEMRLVMIMMAGLLPTPQRSIPRLSSIQSYDML